MPRVVPYEQVVERMTRLGMRSLYHNSGAFGFAEEAAVRHRGWIGPADPTLRPAAQALAQAVRPPFEANLAMLAERAWQEVAPGPAWVMPMSHWSFELEFGSAAWLPAALAAIGVDSSPLRPLNNAPAIEFAADEADGFRHLVMRLLENLAASDFALGFPAHRLRCTIHHHKQLWWSTPDPQLLAGLDSVLERSALLSE